MKTTFTSKPKRTSNWKLITLIIASIFYSHLHLNAQAYQWASKIGASSDDVGLSIANDAMNNVYLSGRFTGTVDFDPGSGTSTLVSVGGSDVFIAKYNSSGVYQWAYGFGGTGSDQAQKLVVDASGDVYMIGKFTGTVDFDPGVGTNTIASTGQDDAFVTKYSSSGICQWAFKLGGTTNDSGNGITVDAGNNIYVTGGFRGTADFDPGAGTVNLTAVTVEDVYLAKYNSNGIYQWAISVGGGGQDIGKGVCVDASNVYLTGSFFVTVDFNPGAGTNTLTANGGSDVFVAQYSTSGTYQWAFKIGSGLGDYGNAVSIDAAGDLLVTGDIFGNADYDPGPSVATLTTVGVYDAFVAKYTNTGNYIWAFTIGAANTDNGRDISSDASGNIYVTGIFDGTADFDPGPGIATMTSTAFNDAFVAKYSPAGGYLWAFKLGGSVSDNGNGLCIDSNGDVLVTGGFMNTVDFDPGSGTVNLTATGPVSDIYMAKYSSSGTGIMGISQEKNNFNVYPNPSTGEFKINYPESLRSGDLEIYNAEGKCVLKQVIEKNSGFELPQGVYFVRATDGKEFYSCKVIIQ
jgi:hypothetical protein